MFSDDRFVWNVVNSSSIDAFDVSGIWCAVDLNNDVNTFTNHLKPWSWCHDKCSNISQLYGTTSVSYMAQHQSVIWHNISQLYGTTSVSYMAQHQSVIWHNISQLYGTTSVSYMAQHQSVIWHNISQLYGTTSVSYNQLPPYWLGLEILTLRSDWLNGKHIIVVKICCRIFCSLSTFIRTLFHIYILI